VISDFDKTGHLMGTLHRALKRNYDRQLKNFSLTPCQFEVLMALWEEDGILLSELGRRVSRDGPTITGVIDRMVKKILVKRKRGSSDRRVVRVILTAKGKSMQEQVSVTRRKVLEKITKNLSSKDIKHLESVLLKIMNNMEEPEFLNN
jgi:DNA-binding MarR family transcriptional regulator